MDKKTIAVDIDDVLADFTEGFIDYANKNWGAEVSFENYTENWGELFGISLDEWGKRAFDLYEYDFYEKLEVISGARGALELLAQDYRIICLTSRHSKVQKQTEGWLKNYFGEAISELNFAGFYEDLDVRSHKKNKGEICANLGADFMIDDQPKHCLGVVECGGQAILFGDYPWNRSLDLPDGVFRARNWNEVVKYFGKEAK